MNALCQLGLDLLLVELGLEVLGLGLLLLANGVGEGEDLLKGEVGGVLVGEELLALF